jgi:hypothetical protein
MKCQSEKSRPPSVDSKRRSNSKGEIATGFALAMTFRFLLATTCRSGLIVSITLVSHKSLAYGKDILLERR